jgi:hypothetical protein
MVLAASLGVMVVATLMLGGWGWAFRRTLGLERGTWPSTVALGMATVVFLGGILNLLRLAHPWALALVAAAGLLLSLAALREIPLERPPLVIVLIIAGIVIFTIVTQLPPNVYNFRDDYEKYFAYPVRMLQTGTVFGSPLSAMGVQTLGGMPFLDGFVVAFFPIVYVNGVDAVFGLFLCLMLASQFTQGRRDLLAMTAVCVLSVIVIDPQYVNISTLYIGSALIMAMVALPMETPAPSAAALGVLYAALIALKPTFALFVAIHLLSIALSTGIRQAVRIGLASAIFLSPWVLLHAPHYLAGLRAHIPPPVPLPGEVVVDEINLFSFGESEYGAPPLCYTALMAAIGICGVLCYRAARSASLKIVASCACGVVSFLVIIYVLSPIHAGYEHSMRYFTPIAIGLAPAAFGWAAYYAATNQVGSRIWRLWLPLIVAIIPLEVFAPSFGTRVYWAAISHSVSSYDWLALDQPYIEYSQKVLYGPERQIVKTLQEKVPAGEPVLVWTNAPFYFDYKRNPIVDIDPAGVGNPWAVVPNAHYLIWSYTGYAMPDDDEFVNDALFVGAGERKNSLRAHYFLLGVESMVKQGQILFDNGESKVVRLNMTAPDGRGSERR